MVAMTGGRGPAMTGGPAYIRDGAAPYREPGSRKPEDAFALLLEAGANPNAKGPDGATLLHQAARLGNLEMIRALAKAKVDFNQKNNDGFTALDVAEGKQPAAARAAARRRTSGRRTRSRSRREPRGCREAAPRADGPAAGARIYYRRADGRTSSEKGALRGRRCCSSRRRCRDDDAGPAVRRPAVSPTPTRRPKGRTQSDRRYTKRRRSRSHYQAMVNRYCVGCHNKRNPASRRRAARARQGQSRRSRCGRGDLGAGGQEAWRRRDAAAGIADARTRGADQVQIGARREPRRRGRRRRTTRAATCCIV